MKHVSRAATILLLFLAYAFAQLTPVNSGEAYPDNGPCRPQAGAPGFCNDQTGPGHGLLVWFDANGVKTAFSAMVGQPGPPGPPGKDGQAATLDAGSTTTGDPGTPAAVSNSGTTNAAVFDFVIPKGDKGDKGDPGPPGIVIGSKITLQCTSGFGNPTHTATCTVTDIQ